MTVTNYPARPIAPPPLTTHAGRWGVFTVILRGQKPLVLHGNRITGDPDLERLRFVMTGPHDWVLDAIRAMERIRLASTA